MTIAFFLIILAVLAIGFAILWSQLKKQAPKEDAQSILLLQNQLQELNRTLDAKLGDSNKALREQFGESQKIVREITQELGRVQKEIALVGESNKQVVNVTDQLKSLQDILKNPKQRGVLGEYYLETVLKNVFPPGDYQMQYAFSDGSVVDAIIKTKDGIIPIDSKFSLENYNRFIEASDGAERKRHEKAFSNDIKLRIDETSKYIKPREKTLEFAFMFIPSEAIYYDILTNKVGSEAEINLIEYAWQKKVIIVSPTTFLAYLQTVLQGFKALKIEEAAKKIAANVHNLGRHLVSYQSYFDKIGAHLGTTVSMYTKAGQELKKIDKDVLKITGHELGLEPMRIEAPETEEVEG
ncbi:MAG: DNA recombination protein RmuC [Candidatus Liptonbacteria bacterium]|nr:DNA recombination protein RmuC [Candidatus Liptonbacteria bacterium]